MIPFNGLLLQKKNRKVKTIQKIFTNIVFGAEPALKYVGWARSSEKTTSKQSRHCFVPYPQALFKAQVTPDPLSTTVMRMTSGLVDGITHRIDGLIGYFILFEKKIKKNNITYLYIIVNMWTLK